MDSDKIVARFPDEIAWQEIFVSINWGNGRYRVHRDKEKSYPLSGKSSRWGPYECGGANGNLTYLPE